MQIPGLTMEGKIQKLLQLNTGCRAHDRCRVLADTDWKLQKLANEDFGLHTVTYIVA